MTVGILSILPVGLGWQHFYWNKSTKHELDLQYHARKESEILSGGNVLPYAALFSGLSLCKGPGTEQEQTSNRKWGKERESQSAHCPLEIDGSLGLTLCWGVWASPTGSWGGQESHSLEKAANVATTWVRVFKGPCEAVGPVLVNFCCYNKKFWAKTTLLGMAVKRNRERGCLFVCFLLPGHNPSLRKSGQES